MTDNTGPRNVIVFGESGAGKSSVINMIAGEQIVESSSSATSGTFEGNPYSVEIDGMQLKLWDTSGINDGNRSEVVTKQAVGNLHGLIQRLEDGVSLLVFCVRGPRINDTVIENYRIFHSVFCQRKVPVVLVVTGLEQEEPMDAWWPANEAIFRRQEILFAGHACVTATKGKVKSGKHIYEEEYEESRKKVRKLISGNCNIVEPWSIETTSWLNFCLAALVRFLGSLFRTREVVTLRG